VSEQFTSPRPAAGPGGADEPTRTDLPTVSGPASAPSTPDGGESAEQSQGAPRRDRRRVLAIAGGAAVAVLAVLYGGAVLAFGGEIPRGTTVAGIEIGGLSEAAAIDKLNAGLAGRLAEPIKLTAGEDSVELDPKTSGLGVDIPATVDDVAGGASPAALWRGMVGGGSSDLVKTADKDALAASLQGVADQLDRAPVDGTVGFADGAVAATPAQVGRALDKEAAAGVIGATFLDSTDPVELPMTESQPTVDQADVDKAVAEFAQPAVSGPVTVVAGDERAVITPSVLTQALTLTPDAEGVLQPALDGEKLLAAGESVFGDLASGAKDASVKIENNRPVVVPGQSGQGIAAADLSQAVLAVLTKSGDERTATVTLSTVEPELTTEQAAALGVASVISETTTSFPYAAYRNTNIGRAAAKIDNTFLKPGDTFSLNKIVGERTEANGFTTGWTIQQGVLKEDLGGGVSQVATTTFNAAYKAGMEDVEHKPHSLYFDRYPAGVEATVAWPSVDLKFTNDTPYGVVVDTVFSAAPAGGSGSLTVKIWSTPYWNSDIQTSGRYAPTTHGVVYDTSPTCEAQAGQDGFQIDVKRTRTAAGEAPKTDKRHVVYNTGSKIVCGPAPAGG